MEETLYYFKVKYSGEEYNGKVKLIPFYNVSLFKFHRGLEICSISVVSDMEALDGIYTGDKEFKYGHLLDINWCLTTNIDDVNKLKKSLICDIKQRIIDDCDPNAFDIKIKFIPFKKSTKNNFEEINL